jgi:hypothetical protein
MAQWPSGARAQCACSGTCLPPAPPPMWPPCPDARARHADFTEMMRAQGDFGPIAMRNFRNPNFDLVPRRYRTALHRSVAAVLCGGVKGKGMGGAT